MQSIWFFVVAALAILFAAVFGPSVYLGVALGVLIDRLVIVPAARALARHDGE